MALRSGGRNLSFEILTTDAAADFYDDADDDDRYSSTAVYRSNSDPPPVLQNGAASPTSSPSDRRKRRKKKKIKNLNPISESSSINPPNVEEREAVLPDDVGRELFSSRIDQNRGAAWSGSITVTETVIEEKPTGCDEFGSVSTITSAVTELRQRNVNVNVNVNEGGEAGERSGEESSSDQKEEKKMGTMKQQEQHDRVEVKVNGSVGRTLEKEESLDWNKLMAQDPNFMFPVEKSPISCFVEEMYAGNSLKSTTTIGNEKEREKVYDTIFRLPWRCELLIDVGFFVCLDSFLSLLTIMPTRIMMFFWRLLKTRQFKRPSAAELCDFGSFVILACGVTLLQQTDISLIYHMIRGQGTIKLYVVYNVLEIFDKLWQNFGGDVMQTLFSSAEGLANCSTENRQYWLRRFFLDEALAVASSIIHSFILLAQAITLSTCIVAHNNALFALLVSNNFAEIKSNVFKRFSKDNIHSLVYFDSVERFHISAFMLFVLAQNILEAEGAWFGSFLSNALVVFVCEMAIDIIKHSFIAKFNDVKPTVFSDYLEDLCKQTLNIQGEHVKKNLTFVPLAPACVVIRVLRPVYAAHLPHNPLPWRLFWIFILSVMTFLMLASLKMMIGLGLRKHARWYINRCRRRKLHCD